MWAVLASAGTLMWRQRHWRSPASAPAWHSSLGMLRHGAAALGLPPVMLHFLQKKQCICLTRAPLLCVGRQAGLLLPAASIFRVCCVRFIILPASHPCPLLPVDPPVHARIQSVQSLSVAFQGHPARLQPNHTPLDSLILLPHSLSTAAVPPRSCACQGEAS